MIEDEDDDEDEIDSNRDGAGRRNVERSPQKNGLVGTEPV